MQERHEFAGGAFKGLFVDEAAAAGRGVPQLSVDVGRRERDVMNAFAILLQKPGDRTLGRRGLEQFEMDFAHMEKCRPHFLRWHLFAVLAFEPERFFVVRDRFVEGADGAEVSDGEAVAGRRWSCQRSARGSCARR